MSDMFAERRRQHERMQTIISAAVGVIFILALSLLAVGIVVAAHFIAKFW